jgi:hypothetical protein
MHSSSPGLVEFVGFVRILGEAEHPTPEHGLCVGVDGIERGV